MIEDGVGVEADYHEYVRKLFTLNFYCLYRMLMEIGELASSSF